MTDSPFEQLRKAGAAPCGPVSCSVVRQVATERLLAELDRLAPLPTVVLDVVRVTEDPDASAADLEALISRDLIIAARVVKLANSAFYARGRPTRTIGEAVMRLGFKTIKSLVLAAGAGKVLVKPMHHYAYSEFGLWQHSLGLALTTRALARLLGLPPAMQEELFLAGLMHDIGKLVLDPILAEFSTHPGWVTIDMELDVAGLDHTDVGWQVAQKWKLPDHAAAVIKQHHALDVSTAFAHHIAAIHLGDYLINHVKVGIPDDADVACELDQTALDILQIDAQRVPQLQAALADELPQIMSLCEDLARC